MLLPCRARKRGMRAKRVQAQAHWEDHLQLQSMEGVMHTANVLTTHASSRLH